MKKIKLSLLGFLFFLAYCSAYAQDNKEAFFKAAKSNDTLTLKKLIKSGIDVNCKSKYGATALIFAIGNEHVETIKILLEHKADPNIRDEFYQETPFEWSFYKESDEILKLMIKHGANTNIEWILPYCARQNQVEKVRILLESKAPGAEKALNAAVRTRNAELVKLLIDKVEIEQIALNKALLTATGAENKEIIELLKNAGAELAEISQGNTANFAGLYGFEDKTLRVIQNHNQLKISFNESEPYDLQLDTSFTYTLADYPTIKFIFTVVDKNAVSIQYISGETKTTYISIPDEQKIEQLVEYKDKVGKVKDPLNWNSFRGVNATGVADGQYPPVHWDAEKGVNLKWKTFIPGQGHACPVTWGQNVYIITAVDKDTTDGFKIGVYGVESISDSSIHIWKLFCLDKKTGKIKWEKKAYEGVPRTKRHDWATQANSTPATNGKYLVALYGSEGMICYDMEGKELWKKDLGLLDAGWFYEEETQWGHASSPIIYKESVIVQVDRSKDSNIAAYDLATGKEMWNTNREEISSWGTPAIYYGDSHNEVITNGTKYAKAYNPDTGEELWKLLINSEITVATPIVYDNLIYITSGYPPVRPVYSIKPGGKGDISLADSLSTSEFINWRHLKGGTYMPSPIAYDGYFYTLANNGVLSCYNSETGEQVYRQSLKAGPCTASIIAADGKLYCTSERKGVIVVHAGPKFEIIAKNPVGEMCRATPAISDKLFIVRGQNHIFCFGRKE
jgi:outer membrane protein assembly factor BamB